MKHVMCTRCNYKWVMKNPTRKKMAETRCFQCGTVCRENMEYKRMGVQNTSSSKRKRENVRRMNKEWEKYHEELRKGISERNEDPENKDRNNYKEYSLMGAEKLEKVDIEEFETMFVWVGDSGATSHMTKVEEGFLSLESCTGGVQFARKGDKETKIKIRTWKERNYIFKKKQKTI